MSFEGFVARQLSQLRQDGLHRSARRIDGIQGPRVSVDGRSALCLCSNNYLGLAGDSALVQLATEILATEGAGSGASRLITGSMQAHRAAESALAEFVGKPAAVLFSSGYACNVGSVQALAGRDDIIFSDALNHASLIDGARLSRAKVIVYEHADPGDLGAKLKRHRGDGRGALVLTESLFSMDGDIAPLTELSTLARDFDAGFLVDDAHALGVYGDGGRGLASSLGEGADLVIGTLGKAFGSQGAFAAGSEAAVDLIRNRARSYVFSTAPSPIVARLAHAAIQLVQAADERRSTLRQHSARLRAGLRGLGFQVIEGESPIIPVVVGESEPTMALSRALLERGVFAHGIRPPTVPAGTGRLRVVPMATHSAADIEEALAAFAEVRT
jgi:8-amino-7-oxononanoate synthase